MIGWIVLIVVTAVFFTVMAAMAWKSVRLFFHDPSVDEWCSAVDEDLDVMYGGWRN